MSDFFGNLSPISGTPIEPLRDSDEFENNEEHSTIQVGDNQNTDALSNESSEHEINTEELFDDESDFSSISDASGDSIFDQRQQEEWEVFNKIFSNLLQTQDSPVHETSYKLFYSLAHQLVSQIRGVKNVSYDWLKFLHDHHQNFPRAYDLMRLFVMSLHLRYRVSPFDEPPNMSYLLKPRFNVFVFGRIMLARYQILLQKMRSSRKFAEEIEERDKDFTYGDVDYSQGTRHWKRLVPIVHVEHDHRRHSKTYFATQEIPKFGRQCWYASSDDPREPYGYHDIKDEDPHDPEFDQIEKRRLNDPEYRRDYLRRLAEHMYYSEKRLERPLKDLDLERFRLTNPAWWNWIPPGLTMKQREAASIKNYLERSWCQAPLTEITSKFLRRGKKLDKRYFRSVFRNEDMVMQLQKMQKHKIPKKPRIGRKISGIFPSKKKLYGPESKETDNLSSTSESNLSREDGILSFQGWLGDLEKTLYDFHGGNFESIVPTALKQSVVQTTQQVPSTSKPSSSSIYSATQSSSDDWEHAIKTIKDVTMTPKESVNILSQLLNRRSSSQATKQKQPKIERTGRRRSHVEERAFGGPTSPSTSRRFQERRSRTGRTGRRQSLDFDNVEELAFADQFILPTANVEFDEEAQDAADRSFGRQLSEPDDDWVAPPEIVPPKESRLPAGPTSPSTSGRFQERRSRTDRTGRRQSHVEERAFGGPTSPSTSRRFQERRSRTGRTGRRQSLDFDNVEELAFADQFILPTANVEFDEEAQDAADRSFGRRLSEPDDDWVAPPEIVPPKESRLPAGPTSPSTSGRFQERRSRTGRTGRRQSHVEERAFGGPTSPSTSRYFQERRSRTGRTGRRQSLDFDNVEELAFADQFILPTANVEFDEEAQDAADRSFGRRLSEPDDDWVAPPEIVPPKESRLPAGPTSPSTSRRFQERRSRTDRTGRRLSHVEERAFGGPTSPSTSRRFQVRRSRTGRTGRRQSLDFDNVEELAFADQFILPTANVEFDEEAQDAADRSFGRRLSEPDDDWVAPPEIVPPKESSLPAGPTSSSTPRRIQERRSRTGRTGRRQSLDFDNVEELAFADQFILPTANVEFDEEAQDAADRSFGRRLSEPDDGWVAPPEIDPPKETRLPAGPTSPSTPRGNQERQSRTGRTARRLSFGPITRQDKPLRLPPSQKPPLNVPSIPSGSETENRRAGQIFLPPMDNKKPKSRPEDLGPMNWPDKTHIYDINTEFPKTDAPFDFLNHNQFRNVEDLPAMNEGVTVEEDKWLNLADVAEQIGKK